MINRFSVENYKALRAASLELTPVHVLIGPNDSGKTSILSSLAALCRSVDMPLHEAFTGSWEGRELVWHGSAESVVAISATIEEAENSAEYHLACRFPSTGRNVVVESEAVQINGSPVPQKDGEPNLRSRGTGASMVQRVCVGNENMRDEVKAACREVHDLLSGVQYFRWNPRTLSLPVAPDATRQFRLNSDGFGLSLLLDDILGYDRDRFSELERRFCSIFPEITSIKLIRQPGFRAPPDDRLLVSKLDQADGKGIYFEVKPSKRLVPAAQVSDGVMMILGYLALLYSPSPARLLLIDEPENGIHPKRLQEVISILREVAAQQSHTQIVLTTHSPYAVDLFSPEQVTLCTKNSDGAIELTRLSECESIADQLSVFSLGEIWTAEGDEGLAKGRQAATTP